MGCTDACKDGPADTLVLPIAQCEPCYKNQEGAENNTKRFARKTTFLVWDKYMDWVL